MLISYIKYNWSVNTTIVSTGGQAALSCCVLLLLGNSNQYSRGLEREQTATHHDHTMTAPRTPAAALSKSSIMCFSSAKKTELHLELRHYYLFLASSSSWVLLRNTSLQRYFQNSTVHKKGCNLLLYLRYIFLRKTVVNMVNINSSFINE